MPVMSGEVYDALTEAGASAEKARKVAEAVAGYDGQFAEIRNELAAFRDEVRTEFTSIRGEFRNELTGVRGEFRNEFTGVRGEFRNEITSVRGELAGMRSELTLLKWMTGFVLAGVLGLMLRVFIPA